MLPKETSVRQLKALRKATKGTDIGDLTANDRLNHNVPNLQYIGNPIDTGIESWEEFSQKDSKLQTIAFKSKLVNKPLVKEKKKKIMENKLNNIVKFSEFDIIKEYTKADFIEPKLGDVIDDGEDDEITESKENQPEYTILGEEKERKSNPNFGVASVIDNNIKKIGSFTSYTKLIDPKTPKERPIGGAAGQFIDNGEVKGVINRIEGKNVYVESVDEPMVIKKFNIKDVVKIY